MQTYITESLADGLVSRHRKECLEFQSKMRSRQDDSSKWQLNKLLMNIFDGVPPKKRKSHIKMIVDAISNLGFQVHSHLPDSGQPIFHLSKIKIKINYATVFFYRAKKDSNEFELFQLNLHYKRKYVYLASESSASEWDLSTNLESTAPLISASGKHLVSRLVQRNQCELVFGLIILLINELYAHSQFFNDTPVGDANIKDQLGGMYLGEIVKHDKGFHQYIAKTYINKEQVQEHNYKDVIHCELELANKQSTK